MPFKSKAQQKFMFAKKPEMANRWAKETPNIDSLPEHAPKLKKNLFKRNLKGGI